MPRKVSRSPSSDSTQSESDRTQSSKSQRSTYEDRFMRMTKKISDLTIGGYRMRDLGHRKGKKKTEVKAVSAPPSPAGRKSNAEDPPSDEESYCNVDPKLQKKTTKKNRRSMSVGNSGIRLKDERDWKTVGVARSPDFLRNEPDSDSEIASRKKKKGMGGKTANAKSGKEAKSSGGKKMGKPKESVKKAGKETKKHPKGKK